MCLSRTNKLEVSVLFEQCMRRLLVVEHHITRQLSMHLPPLSWWIGACLHPMHGGVLTIFFFYLSFLSFQPWKICGPCKKLEKGVWFVKLIKFGHLFICIKFFFFNSNLLFDFSIEFILLFYVVLGLTLDVLISNFDFWFFY